HTSLTFSSYTSLPHTVLHSFPTRRSSDLRFQNNLLTSTTVVDIAMTLAARSGKFPLSVALVMVAPSPVATSSCLPKWTYSETMRSEEHTSELQSRFDLVCRLLLEKKKTRQ